MASLQKAWPSDFPKEKALRKDIQIMLSCFQEVLFRHVPKSNIIGIYFKGSASKKWDSIIDYVPGISDIDIHFILKNPSKFEKMSLDEAFKFSSELRDLYKKKNKKPAHFPIVQINLLNKLMKKDFYSPTPKEAVKTIYGKKYEEKKIILNDELKKSIKKVKEDAPLGKEMPLKVIDKAGRYEKYLQQLSWKISPCIPNYVFLKIKDYKKSWTMNRTELARTLKELGEEELAENYTKFYTEAWKYYISKSEKSLINAIRAGSEVLTILEKRI